VSEATPPILPNAEPFQTNKTLAIIALVVGILSCGCLTIIMGILGIVYANKAQTLWSGGDIAGASSAASTARVFAIIGFVLAVVWAIFAIIGTTAGFLSVPGMS
jgi:uncharacterized membrane protein